MNDRPLYLLGIGASAYALWYFASINAYVPAVAFGIVTLVLVVRLRKLIAGS